MNSNKSLAAGALTAIGASVCCIGPLLLVTAGISGAWIARLTAFEPYRPIFFGLTLLFLAIAFYKLYFQKPSCEVGSDCDDKSLKRRRVMFWVVSVPLLLVLAFPWYASFLF